MVIEKSAMFWLENFVGGAKSESDRREHYSGGSGKARR